MIFIIILLALQNKSKLQGEKLKKAIDDFHNYTSGTTKQIKSKPDTVSEDLEILDAPTENRYDVGTKIYKVFDGTEYKGSIMGYNNMKMKIQKICIIMKLNLFIHPMSKVYLRRRDGRRRRILLQPISSKDMHLLKWIMKNMYYPCQQLMYVLWPN